MKKIFLPSFLKPYQCDTLDRVGRDFDGGYLINNLDIIKSKALISFGISDDWSFEKELLKKNDMPLYAYDATLNTRFLVQKVVKFFFRLKPIRTCQSLIKLFNYFYFFRNNKLHFRKYVGLANNPRFVTLDFVLNKIKSERGLIKDLFLKIDIEGWEYRVLHEIIENHESFSALAIEFHDVDIHLDKIEKFILDFPLKLIHVHANNSASINGSNCPLVIECTFSANSVSVFKTTIQYPHSLDMPNDAKKEEYQIEFHKNLY